MSMIKSTALAAAILAGCFAGAAQAQNAERTYDNGPVWTVGYVETKPGMFDDYIAYLAGPWKMIQEAGKKRGDILDYKILAVDSPREHESDVILLIEYKNMAVFDRALADLDKDTNAAYGSNPASNKAAVAREQVRVLHGGVTTRELKFLK